MRAKTLIGLLTLSTNLYMISKDEEFMRNLTEMLGKGKKKAEELLDEFSGDEEDGEEKLLQKFLHKAQQAKEELERKIEEAAIKVYQKMHIAHTDEVKVLQNELSRLKTELSLMEARLVNLEPKKA